MYLSLRSGVTVLSGVVKAVTSVTPHRKDKNYVHVLISSCARQERFVCSHNHHTLKLRYLLTENMPRGSGNSSSSSSGYNSQGNHYNTPGGTNSSSGSAYHYSNSNGSYYYSNDNGSSYYNSGSGSSQYTAPSGGSQSSDSK